MASGKPELARIVDHLGRRGNRPGRSKAPEARPPRVVRFISRCLLCAISWLQLKLVKRAYKYSISADAGKQVSSAFRSRVVDFEFAPVALQDGGQEDGVRLDIVGATGQYRVVQWVRGPPREGLASRRVARPWEASSNVRF